MENFNNESIGFKLKMLRLSKGMTAKAVAQKLNVSPAYVSMLERGKSNFNLTLLLKLMDVYGETLSDFLKSSGSEGRIHHLEDMHLFTEDGGKLNYRLIRSNGDPSIFRPYRFDLLPGGSTGISEPHVGTEYIYVLEGECVVSLASQGDGEIGRYVMHATDSIYYSSADFHCVNNESESPCSFLLVFSPFTEENGEPHRNEGDHFIGGTR